MNKIVPDFQGADDVIESKSMDREQHYKADDAEPVAEKVPEPVFEREISLEPEMQGTLMDKNFSIRREELQGWKYIYFV